uniref:Putative phage metallopeptidase domain-containing protein n=1 Tax=viral metagenome TaxID=1070528 RepID=A0A6M3L0L4_9ZZZZ
MSNRYEHVTDQLVEVFLNVVEERFPELQNLKVYLVFDLKKRMNRGKFVLASIEKASSKIKFFTETEDNPEGYDLILIVNKNTFDIASDKDRKRIISHELRHVLFDEEGKILLIGHDICDFSSEIELNIDDPRWKERLTTEVLLSYE